VVSTSAVKPANQPRQRVRDAAKNYINVFFDALNLVDNITTKHKPTSPKKERVTDTIKINV
jgi:hypothetical protein